MLAGTLALGCGAPGTEGSDNEPESTLARAEQPLVYWDAYGIDAAGNRCWYDNGNSQWAGGYCRMPNGLNWTVVIPDANRTGGCDPDTRVGASNAAIDFRDFMNARGWNITLLAASEVKTPFAFDAHVADVTCDDPANHSGVDANSGGITVLQTKDACIFGSLAGVKCLDAGRRGTIVSFDTAYGPYMFEVRWKSRSYWAGKTTTQKRRFTRNLVLHELFHHIGLGHDTFQETPLMGIGSNITYAFDHDLWPTDFESSMLACVNPNRNGLFERCIP